MKRFLPFLLIAAGFMLVLTGISAGYVAREFQDPEIAPLPLKIAGHAMISRFGGQAALSEVRDLHQQEFPLVSGAVGQYGMNGEATIWVAGAPFQWIASRMLRSMHEKIGQGNSPFSPTRVQSHKQHTVYELEGMGQKHFYFQSGKLIIWLAVNQDLAEMALEETLAFYR